jgi:hypothetical protein
MADLDAFPFPWRISGLSGGAKGKDLASSLASNSSVG